MFLPQIIVLLFLCQGSLSRSLAKEGNGDAAVRKPRSLSSIISLLWPQVVGPMRDGHIIEPSYDEIAMSPMEIQLRGVRARSQAEMGTRQHIRDIVNNRIPQSVYMSMPFYEFQLHPLFEQHVEMLPNPPPHVFIDSAR